MAMIKRSDGQQRLDQRFLSDLKSIYFKLWIFALQF